MRAVVDTNVWVSAIIHRTGYPARLKQAWLDGRFVSVLSPQLVTETVEVLHRPRIQGKYGISDEEINTLEFALSRFSEVVYAPPVDYHLRDPKDDYLLSTAIVARAEFIVTRDGDLRGDADLPSYLSRFGTQVVSVQQFLEILEAI